MCDTEGVYRKLSTAKKMQAGNYAREFFAVLASTNARRRKFKEKKKRYLSLAIGKNYINKKVSFLLV